MEEGFRNEEPLQPDPQPQGGRRGAGEEGVRRARAAEAPGAPRQESRTQEPHAPPRGPGPRRPPGAGGARARGPPTAAPPSPSRRGARPAPSPRRSAGSHHLGCSYTRATASRHVARMSSLQNEDNCSTSGQTGRRVQGVHARGALTRGHAPQCTPGQPGLPALPAPGRSPASPPSGDGVPLSRPRFRPPFPGPPTRGRRLRAQRGWAQDPRPGAQ